MKAFFVFREHRGADTDLLVTEEPVLAQDKIRACEEVAEKYELPYNMLYAYEADDATIQPESVA